MYGWELLISDRLKETRSLEVKYLSTRKYLDAWCVFFWATTPTLFSLSTFGLFTVMGHSLNAATVFTCLALFNTLISPLNSFPWVINGLIDANISMRRLSKFLACAEHISERVPSVFECRDDSSQHMAVVLRDVSCNWSHCNENKQSSMLNHINLDLPKGFLVAVIGEVGSGKSALLNSVLGEMHLLHGSIHSCGSIAYVSQVTWVLSGTIRDNILFGKKYIAKSFREHTIISFKIFGVKRMDAGDNTIPPVHGYPTRLRKNAQEDLRYAEVLRACALDADLSLMVGGWRALYYGADIFMLDYVFSAVDAQVACWILYHAIFSPLTNQNTHKLLQAICSADMIVVMDKGYVKWSGSLADFSSSPYSTIPSLQKSKISSSQLLVNESISNASDVVEHSFLLKRQSLNISEEAQEVIGLELRKEGKIELGVYK
ncbi:hypothetical protein GIB67_034683 [Kingdonia uniflora]|uniref:ABC transporter C family member 13 n=1 Tax=Kingdonia uniflora TaxID=39325 RepID=A0A7J7P066_9MAGN|nr:hypothetical protein GIB67_034683 [Kingdonia uniflora]